MNNRKLKKYSPIFLGPMLIAFTAVFIVPFAMGLYLSLCKFTTVDNAVFIGFENFKAAFTDQNFLNALWFTVKFTVVSVITVNVIAFFLALLLTRGMRGSNLFRTVFFMPNLIGGIVLGYIWNLILNGVLGMMGVDITYSANYGFWGLVILMNWQMIGYMMVIYIAGIQSIPGSLIEASHIDGASGAQTLRRIIMPMIMPSVTICTFLTLSNSFKLFDQNLALTNGAPNRETAMMALDIYNTFYGSVGQQGVGQAKAVIFAVIVALIAWIQLKITRSREEQM
jgi:raffinose/stachyose/melibiose transport system permease protein